MSFMSVPALDRLLEQSERGSSSSHSTSSSQMDRDNLLVRNRSLPFYPSHPYSSPSTPPPQRPRTPSPSSCSPSPYVLNFKRRVSGGSSNGKSIAVPGPSWGIDTSSQSGLNQAHQGSTSSSRPESGGVSGSNRNEDPVSALSGQKKKLINGRTSFNEDGTLPVREVQNRLYLSERLLERDRTKSSTLKKSEKLMSKAGLKCEVPRKDDLGKALWAHASSSGRPFVSQDSGFSSISSSNGEEFFDAPEAPLDDYQSDEESVRSGQRSARSTSSGRGDADANLEWQLEQEIKRRIAAEDAMVLLQQQRNEMACHLAYIDGGGVGLIDSERDVWDAAYQAQKLVVAREVASSIARGAARAAAEEELETVIADKNREVARLRDKLQYFELVNHEMSQRNQEAIEIARRRRHLQQSQNRWLIGCTGAAVCVGVSAALVYYFVPWSSSWVRAGAALENHLHHDSDLPPPSAHNNIKAKGPF